VTRTGPVGGGNLVSSIFGAATTGSDGCGGIGPSDNSSRKRYRPKYLTLASNYNCVVKSAVPSLNCS